MVYNTNIHRYSYRHYFKNQTGWFDRLNRKSATSLVQKTPKNWLKTIQNWVKLRTEGKSNFTLVCF